MSSATAEHLCDVVSAIVGAAVTFAGGTVDVISESEALTVTPHPPTSTPCISLRVTECELTNALGGHGLQLLTIDILSESLCEVPASALEAARLLTGATDVASFWSSLAGAGVRRLDMYVCNSTSPLLECCSMLVEATPGDNLTPTLPLLSNGTIVKPDGMLGSAGFRVDLLFTDGTSNINAADARDVAIAVMKSTSLLLPPCDMHVFCDRDMVVEDTAPAFVYSASGNSMALPGRLARVMHDDAAHPLITAVGSASLGGTSKAAPVWNADVLLVSDASQLQSAQHTPVPILVFLQSTLQRKGGFAMDSLRAVQSKRFAEQLKSLCGVSLLLAADATSCITHAGMMSVQHAAADAQGQAPLPTTIVAHFTASDGVTGQAHWKRRSPAPSSARRRRRLLSSALFMAFDDLKQQSGGLLATTFEQLLRCHGLPAAATAIARILSAGGPHMQQLSVALVERAAQPPMAVEAVDAAELFGDNAHATALLVDSPPPLDHVVTTALLHALDVSIRPKNVSQRVMGDGNESAHVGDEATEPAASGKPRRKRRQREVEDGVAADALGDTGPGESTQTEYVQPHEVLSDWLL